MSLRNTMNTGVTGLQSEGRALGVVGDNVANINTVGFKSSRAIFEDVLGGAVGGISEGGGVRVTRTQQIFGQGSLLNTGEPTDVALSGDGFFVVQGSIDGVHGTFYSRAGQTSVRNDGMLVNPQGLTLQGYAANSDGTFSSSLGPIQVPTSGLPPRATGVIGIGSNLDSTAATPTGAWDPANPVTTSNFSTSITTYDSLGNAHSVNVYFRKNSANTWEYHALVNGSELTGGTAGRATEVAAGTLSFTTGGALQAHTVTAGGTVNFVGARPGQTLTFDFGTSIASGGTGLDGLTQFASASTVTAQRQDGYAPGDLNGVHMDANGTVSGVFSNGQTVAMGKLAIARFRSNDGLGRMGHNVWSATHESGEAAIGAAGEGGRGAVVSGALEQSNVDITQQFVELIAHQRSFQANSKTITTADQMLQELMNLNR